MVELIVDKQQSGAAVKGVPAGFKLTAVGVIPEDWNVSTILNLTTNIIDYRGRTPKKLGMDWGHGDIVALSAGNVKKGYIDLSSECYFASEELYKRWMTSGHPKKGDIAFTMEAPLGNAASIPDDNRYILSQRTILLQIDEDKFSPSLILQILLSYRFQLYISESVTGSTAQGIKRSILERLCISIPKNMVEQKAIANVLVNVDSLINSLERLLTKKQAIKTATMQQLLTGKTRLPQFALQEDGTVKGYKKSELGEIPEDWSIENFSTLATLRNERINPRTKDIEFLCIELEHIISEYGQLNGFTETSGTSSIKNVFSPNDILFGKLRSYLKKYWKATQSGVCSTEIWVLKTELHKAIPEFIFQTVKTDRFVQTASEAYGTHMPRADWKIIKELQVATPSIEEQTAITAILSDMDKEIQTLQQRLDKTRQLKQGMMQELLTGKTRLI